MVKNNFDTPKIESELFALVKSITNLNKKYQKGSVNTNFFRKALKNAMNNLLKLNFILKENDLLLPVLLERMNLSQEYQSAIDIINRVSSLDFLNDKGTTKNQTFLELPGITSEITSTFITLMDALTLDGLTKTELITNLFNELIYNLGKFPGLDDIATKVKEIQNNTLNHIERLISDKKLKKTINDELYGVFKEFQNKLNIKP
ncbi:MAG: hypothetical protein ACFE9I_18890 [Candidatus Hermodarchaeota archaeon]